MNTLPTIPDHTLLHPIGRGAYGEVWLARNVMGVLRAVKIVRRAQFESVRPYEREFAGIERYEPVSRSSSGLVHLLHVGRNDGEGYFYYVMELADDTNAECGVRSAEFSDSALNPTPHSALLRSPHSYAPRTLRSDLKRLGRLATADCLRLALDVVSGLGQLHLHGLVHRDVKPGNIIFVNGRAKLADIGLVSTHGEGRTFVGTEGYIPPEGPGSPAADLYALGIVLYEAITGNAPERFPDVPADWFADAAGEEALEFHEVILKACEGQRERRYQSAEEMQVDLALLQSGQSVRRVRALERRYARLRWIGMAVTALLACALVGLLFANYRTRLAAKSQAKEMALREQTERSLLRAEAAERETRQQLYTALLEQARATVLSGEMGQRVRALDALRRAAGISNTAELRREVFAALALPDLRFERELPYGEQFARSLDSTFERIALSVTRGRGAVEIRSTSDRQLLGTLPASTNLPVYVIEWSPDGRFLAVKRDHPPDGFRADWEIWEMNAPRRILLLRDLVGGAVAFHPQRPQVFLGQRGGATLWDLDSGAEVSRFRLNGTPIRLRFAPEGDRFAAFYLTTVGWQVSVHDVSDPGAPPWASQILPARVATLNWHPSGRWLAVADLSGGVHQMDAQTGETRVLGRHHAEAVKTEFSPDGVYMFSGAWGGEIFCWDAKTLQRAFNIRLNSHLLQFRADGRVCAVTTTSGVQLHAFERPSGYREFPEDLGPRLAQAAFSPDGRWLAASGDKRLGLWDLTASGPGALDENAHAAHCFFTPDGRELFSSRSRRPGNDDCFRWRIAPATDANGPPQLERLPLHKPSGFAFLSLSANSVVMTSTNGTQVLAPEEIETGKEIWSRTYAGINRVSPDARWVGIFRHFTPSLYIHRLPGLERAAKLNHLANLHHFEFSPRGDEVALFSTRGVELWSTATWERTRLLTNFSHPILYTPDGRNLWLTRRPGMAGLYDARTLEPQLLLPTGMLPRAVSPDGRYLAVSVESQRLQVWDLTALRQQFRELGLDWR